jgi:citrate lyase alpha subunit
LYHATVGEHHSEAQHVLAHGPITHGVGARGTGRGHTAYGSVGAGIDGKEQTRVTQMIVELLSGYPRLHSAVQIIVVDLENGVHLREIDAHTAVQGLHVAFERGARAVGDDRNLVARTHADDGGHVLGAASERHRIRGGDLVKGLVLAVLLTHGFRRRQAVAEELSELENQRIQISRRGGHERFSKGSQRRIHRPRAPIPAKLAALAATAARPCGVACRVCSGFALG